VNHWDRRFLGATGRWWKACARPTARGSARFVTSGELNDSAHARWLKTIEVFNEQGEAQQWKLVPSEVELPANDPDVAQVLLKKMRLERTRQLAPAIWVGIYSGD
jgi:hypothetical protein